MNNQSLLSPMIETGKDKANHPETFLMSVIIPCYNREDSLPLVLSRMQELRHILKGVEILVIDDGSTDGTKRILDKFEKSEGLVIRCSYQANGGAANARNTGIKMARSSVVLFLDADIIPSEELFQVHLEFHQMYPNTHFILRGQVEAHPDAPGIRKLGTTSIRSGDSLEELDWTEFRSNNISAKREFLLKAGGFDGELSAHQDTELGHRLSKRGMRLFHSSKALGLHYHPVDLKGYFRYAEKYGRSRAIWLSKSPELIEDAVHAGCEDRYGFISWKSLWSKKIKHVLKIVFVNRVTADLLVAIGRILEKNNDPQHFFFYRQAYQYYSRMAFKRYWREIQSGRMNIRRPLRICMLAGPLPPEFSGAAIQSLRLSEYLRRHGQEVLYISPTFKEELEGEGYVQGMQVRRIFLRSKSPLEKLKFSMKTLVFLIRNRSEFDVVHLHGGGFLATGATLLCKILGKKSVYKMTSFGEDDPQKVKKTRYSWLKLPLLQMADKVVAISSGLAESYRRCNMNEENLSQIPNCVDSDRFFPVSKNRKYALRKKLDLPEDAFIVVSVSSISFRKRVDFLVQSWEKVAVKYKKVLLVLVGGFPDDEKEFVSELKGRIASPIYLDKVLLTGFRKNTEEYLQAADLFVFASLQEGFASVKAEAMACGLPCLCTYISGLSEDIFVSGENGIVMRDPSVEAFSRNIVGLMKNPNLSENLGRNARITVENKFSLNQVGKEYLKLYASMMSDAHFVPRVQLARA